MEKKTSDPSKRNRDFSQWNGDESSQRSDFSKNKGWFSNEMLVIFQNKTDVTHQTHTSESEWWWCANEMGASNWSERSGPWGPQSWSVDSLWNYERHPPPNEYDYDGIMIGSKPDCQLWMRTMSMAGGWKVVTHHWIKTYRMDLQNKQITCLKNWPIDRHHHHHHHHHLFLPLHKSTKACWHRTFLGNHSGPV